MRRTCQQIQVKNEENSPTNPGEEEGNPLQSNIPFFVLAKLRQKASKQAPNQKEQAKISAFEEEKLEKGKDNSTNPTTYLSTPPMKRKLVRLFSLVRG
jgi:hypothetical protein